MTTTQKVLVGVGLGAALSCCGLTGALLVYGFGVYRGEVCEHLASFEVVVSRLGTPVKCSAEVVATGAVDDRDTFVFALTGPKGKGRAWVKSSDAGGRERYQGVLVIIDGQEYLLEGERPPIEGK